MTSLKITTIALATLFSQIALADQPCGNYGISTTQQPCAAPQVVYAQPPQVPCPPQQQQTQQAPIQQQTQAPAYGFGFRPRASVYAYQQQPLLGARFQSRRQEAAAPDYGRGLEIGARGIQDATTLEIGAGLYLRGHQQGGQQRLGVELSADVLGADLLAQGALMYYLNPNGFIKPFGLLGGGLELNSGETIAQAGFGLDVELGRLTVTGDVRAVESLSGGFECLDAECLELSSFGTSLLLGNIGVSRKF